MTEQEEFEITPDVRAALSRFSLVLKALLALNPRITTAQARTFLAAAMSEHTLTISGLAAVCEVGPTTITKHGKDLGAFRRNGAPGLRLLCVERWPYDDQRQHRVVLTDWGIKFAQALVEIHKGDREDLGGLVQQRTPVRRSRRGTPEA